MKSFWMNWTTLNETDSVKAFEVTESYQSSVQTWNILIPFPNSLQLFIGLLNDYNISGLKIGNL